MPGPRILLVDDEDLLRQLGTRILHSAGYSVLSARTGAEALEILEAHDGIQLVLSDIRLPGMSGLELAAQIADRYPAVQVLLTSGYTEESLGGFGARRPFHFVAKPYTKAELTLRVRELLGNQAPGGAVTGHEGSPE